MKVIFEKVPRCDKCPYFHMHDVPYDVEIDAEQWYECGLTDKILIYFEKLDEWQREHEMKYPFTIPIWCPLENWDLFHYAIDATKEQQMMLFAEESKDKHN